MRSRRRKKRNYANLKIYFYKHKITQRGKLTGYKNYYSFLCNKLYKIKMLQLEGKTKCYEITWLKQKDITNTKSHFFRGILNRKQNLAILETNKAVNKAECTWQDERNTLATRTGEDKDYIHMREQRWKQSGIREDGRPVSQEEGQVTWTRGELLFKIKHVIHKTKKNQYRTSLTVSHGVTLCWEKY